MSEEQKYITAQQAVAILKDAGVEYGAKYFIRKFLEPGNELLPIAPQCPGERKRRRIRILRVAILAMIEPELQKIS